MPARSQKPRRLAGGEKSLNTAVCRTLRTQGPSPALRAAVAVDLIIKRLEVTYPEVEGIPRQSRWLVPAALIHPSLRVSA